MSYTVFALKWRPNNFDQIAGQNHIVTTLKNAITKNRLAHAYLFSGPRGVGKTSTARILAKALNCKEGPTANPCGICPSCVGISKGQSLDVLEIDGASNRGIDEIRALRESVKFAPAQGKFKIYIIDEVHQITQEGFNALLKTLEEPPEYVKFIFATTHPHKVMPTILSRCQRLDFRRITVMEIIEQLEKITAAEGISVEKEVLSAIARSSDGSLRDAESVLDQLIAFAKDKVSLKDVTAMLGLVEQDVLFKLTASIIAKDASGALALVNEVIDNGKDIDTFLNNIIEHFRNLMVAKVAQADSELIDLPFEICEKLYAQAKQMDLDEILHAFTVFVNAHEMSKRMDSMRIPLEISIVKLARGGKKEQPAVPVEENITPEKPFVKDAFRKPQSSSQPLPQKSWKPAPPVVTPPAPEVRKETLPQDKPVPPQAAVSLDEVKGSWPNLINNLSSIKMSVATYLNEGSPLTVEGNTLTVGFPKHCSLHKEALEAKDNRTIVEKNITELMNAALKIHFILSEEVTEEKKPREASDTFVRSALDMFNGRVIKEG